MQILMFVIIDTSQVWDLFNPLHVQRPAAFLCRNHPLGRVNVPAMTSSKAAGRVLLPPTVEPVKYVT